MNAGHLTAITYRYERWRAVADGVLETAGQTFLLLLAVRVFEAGATAKGIVATGNSAGLLLSLLVVSVFSARRWRSSRAAALLSAAGAGGFLLAALAPVLPVFIFGGVAGLACAVSAYPLFTQMYQENYPAAARGKLFSRTLMIRVGVAAGFSELAGRALSVHIQWFQGLLLAYAVALGFASYCLSRCPSQPLASAGGTRPFRALRLVRDDRVFRLTLICWMLMGFANLMMLPMRVEYLANPRYGVALSTGTIALLTGVIPNLARLLLSPVWGRLFDRMNFFALRVMLNLGFALGILAFFTGHTLWGFVLGAIIFGISTAGGDVAWTLWVTKIAPPDRVAEYMSVHTFFTGLRGIIAPLVGFHLVNRFSMGTLGGINAGLIVLASLILVREIKTGKSPDPGTAVVERATN